MFISIEKKKWMKGNIPSKFINEMNKYFYLYVLTKQTRDVILTLSGR